MTKSTTKNNVSRVWSAVRFMIGFHKDAGGKVRDKAFVWSPKDGHATIRDDVTDAEVFCEIESANGEDDKNVQIKMHPDKLILRRTNKDYWNGIVASEFDVQVQVGDTWIKIGYDGSVTRQTDSDTTNVEADGSVFKETLYSTAHMSADGTDLSSSTDGQVSRVSPMGIMQAQRREME